MIWTRARPRKPYTLLRYGDFVIFVSFLVLYYYPDGSPGGQTFTFDRNWNGIPINNNGTLQASYLGNAWLVRKHISVNRSVTRLVGNNNVEYDNRFYDQGLDTLLGGEKQRLG